jgi:hypothetical protein
MSRLPVGHTHEDIDACFGMIWELIKDYTVLTPDDYKRLILIALKNKTPKQRVVDIFAVPDFHDLLEECIDPNFSHFKVI